MGTSYRLTMLSLKMLRERLLALVAKSSTLNDALRIPSAELSRCLMISSRRYFHFETAAN